MVHTSVLCPPFPFFPQEKEGLLQKKEKGKARGKGRGRRGKRRKKKEKGKRSKEIKRNEKC